MADASLPTALFPHIFPDRQILAQFDTSHSTSDGGAALLKACDERLQLTHSLAATLSDPRSPSRCKHSLRDLFRQRVFSLGLGYEDCNDAARLRCDPSLKLTLDRNPVDGPDLASQPTLCRFENSVTDKQLAQLQARLERLVVEHHKRCRRSARVITIDSDPTCDPVHGLQQLSLFNGFYDTRCFLPLVTTLSFDNDPEQYFVSVLLRSGTAPAAEGLQATLERLLPLLRQHFPKARLRIRLDSGFQGGHLLDWLRKQNVRVILCLASNKVLQRHAQELVEKVRKEHERWLSYQAALAERAQALSEGREAGPRPRPAERPRAHYDQVAYRAGSWSRPWRVVMRAEIVEHAGRQPKLNVRYVLTDERGSARRIYERLYCPRGDAENRLKELKRGLSMDRTSCHRFEANQLRVLLTAAAYVLLQELRRAARGTEYGRAQVERLRLHLLKLGARIEQAGKRVVLHLPRGVPAMGAWLAIAANLGAIVPPT